LVAEVEELESGDPSIHARNISKKKKRFRSFCMPENISEKQKKRNHRITTKKKDQGNNFGVVVVQWGAHHPQSPSLAVSLPHIRF
jgi:hypothetical protein